MELLKHAEVVGEGRGFRKQTYLTVCFVLEDGGDRPSVFPFLRSTAVLDRCITVRS